MIDIEVPKQEVDKILATFAATRAQIDRASLRAINKTIRWVHTNLKRIYRQELAASGFPVAQKHLTRRLKRLRASRRRRLGIVWLGLNAFPLIALGKGRRTKQGRVVKGRLYRQVFHAAMPTGHEGHFKRKGETRLPIVTQYFKHEITPESLIGRTEKLVLSTFLRIFRAELNYELNVRAKR